MVRLHTQPGNDLHPGDQVGGHRVHRPQDDHQQDQLGRVDRKAAQQGQARQDQQQSQGILSYLLEAAYLVDVAILYGLLNLLAVAVLSRISVRRHREKRGEEP